MFNRLFTVLLITCAFASTVGIAAAKPGFLPTLVAAYPAHSAALQGRMCANCHVQGGTSRNAYGKALEALIAKAGGGQLTADEIKQADSMSASAGGPTFGSLINSDKDPGVVQAAAPAPKPVKPTPPAATKPAATSPSTKPAAAPAPGKPAAPAVPAATAPGAVPAATAPTTPAAPATAPATSPATPATAAPPAAPAAPESSPAPATAPPPPPLVPDNGFHPIFVHFPIALFICGLFLDLLGLIRKNNSMLLAGWYNLALAATSSLAAVATGLTALILQKLPLDGIVRTHMLLGLVVTVLMWAMFGLRAHQHERITMPARIAYYILAAATLLLIAYVGHLGGKLVYGG